MSRQAGGSIPAGTPCVTLRAAPPCEGGLRFQNAALSENTTWLPEMLEPSLVLEKFGSR